MIEQLKSAAERLRASLDHYLSICSSIQSCSANGLTRQKISRELAHQLDSELACLSSYEATIQQARHVISRTRNYSSPLVPINCLPPEIVTRIFLNVAFPCNLHLLPWDYEGGFPRYPQLLLGVCFGWYQTILSNPSLWVHIDLTFEESQCQNLLARAESHLERSGRVPLEIHLVDSDDTNIEHDVSFFDFIGSIAIRAKTLEFEVTGPFEECHPMVFDELLKKAPFLTELIIRSYSMHHSNAFICSEEEDHISNLGSGGLVLWLSPEEMEFGFEGLEVLHLQGIFPYWTSSAYCQLVDLRLTSFATDWSSITQQQLARILRECPGLQIFHLALTIERISNHKKIEPVYLQDLEVINLSADPDNSPASQMLTMLQLLAPGDKLVRLTLRTESYDRALVAELKEFQVRAQVTHLCLKDAHPPLKQLLHFAPWLTNLIFDSCTYKLDPRLEPAYPRFPNVFPPSMESFPHLRLWHVLNSQITLDGLSSMVELDENQALALSGCTFVDQGSQPEPMSDMELSTAFPSVRFVPNNVQLPNPTAEWNLLY